LLRRFGREQTAPRAIAWTEENHSCALPFARWSDSEGAATSPLALAHMAKWVGQVLKLTVAVSVTDRP